MTASRLAAPPQRLMGEVRLTFNVARGVVHMGTGRCRPDPVPSPARFIHRLHYRG